MRNFFVAAIAAFALTAAAYASVFTIWGPTHVDSPAPWVCKMCRPGTPAGSLAGFRTNLPTV
jgi:hypothetical protein